MGKQSKSKYLKILTYSQDKFPLTYSFCVKKGEATIDREYAGKERISIMRIGIFKKETSFGPAKELNSTAGPRSSRKQELEVNKRGNAQKKTFLIYRRLIVKLKILKQRRRIIMEIAQITKAASPCPNNTPHALNPKYAIRKT